MIGRERWTSGASGPLALLPCTTLRSCSTSSLLSSPSKSWTSRPPWSLSLAARSSFRLGSPLSSISAAFSGKSRLLPTATLFSRFSLGAWSDGVLGFGIAGLWLFSAALWAAILALCPPGPSQDLALLIWHVHCVSRLPQIIAGVLLGALVERWREEPHLNRNRWAIVTDLLSLFLLATAVQAPVRQWMNGTSARLDDSIGMEAVFLPLHALWLAGMVLAYRPEEPERVCCTRVVLSARLLLALGDISLVLYCVHIPVLFAYSMVFAYVTTGDWHLAPTIADYDLRVKAPWWHAPFQWILVLAVSFLVARWFEAPMRNWLSAAGPKSATHSAVEPAPRAAPTQQFGGQAV
mmetsp:Transcript_30874/g.46038  ORF Transcript_30874/g.46038 Transcript_30874/m.46038 type:complete len:350 (-) Transcript_30874:508-1557(-)